MPSPVRVGLMQSAEGLIRKKNLTPPEQEEHFGLELEHKLFPVSYLANLPCRFWTRQLP